MILRKLFLGVAVVLAVGCSTKRIPGTEIDDNDETRAIPKVNEQDRMAVEARDANRVIGLVADTFRDNGGSEAGAPQP